MVQLVQTFMASLQIDANISIISGFIQNILAIQYRLTKR